MGRTIPSYRIILEEELKRWERFRDALRIDEREVFEDMMDKCRRRASAAGAACFPIPSEGMFLIVLFAHHKTRKELNEKIERANGLIEKLSPMPVGITPRTARPVELAIVLTPSARRPNFRALKRCKTSTSSRLRKG